MRAGLDERRGERDGDTLTLKGELLDPMSKQPADVRLVTRVVGKDHHVFEMYMTLQGVPEFKMMQIDYVREGGD